MRKRDYKAEYQARKARAKARGYTGYSQQRKKRAEAKHWAEVVVQRMEDTGLIDSGFFEKGNGPDDPESFDTSMFWELWRNYYGVAISA